MKNVFSFLLAILLQTMAFGQGYNVEVCVNLTGPPITGPVTATLTYYANGNLDTASVVISNVTPPYTFCFPAYFQTPDSGFFATANGTVTLSNCGPAQAINYSQQISTSTTINLNMQNCQPAGNCSATITPILGTTLIQANPTGVAPFTYSWDNGLTFSGNSLFQLTTPGNYCVIIQDATGCSASACYSYNAGNCSASISVVGSGPWTLTASGTGVPPLTYLWSDGSTTSSIIATTGVYCLTVTDAIGCTDTACVTFNNPPICNAYITQGLDSAGNIILIANLDSNLLGIGAYTPNWSNGIQSQFIYPNSPGQYCVQIVYLNSCYANACYNFNPGNPVGGCSVYATATPDSNFIGLVHFNSFPTGTPPFTYQWLFSNGVTSTLANPSINFAYISGQIWGQLSVTDALGCVSNYSMTAVLPNNNSNCVAAFLQSANYQFGNAGEVFFQNMSTSFAGITDYAWSFGDGDSSSLMNPTHIYTSAGYYNVCLMISNGGSCTSIWCTSIYIDPAWWSSNPFQGPCTAGFLIFTSPGMMNVVNTSQGNNLQYTWDFGNGIISNNPTPFITYNSPGSYNVCLNILDTVSACTSTFCDSVSVDSLGNITRSPMSGNVGAKVSSSPQPNSLLSLTDLQFASKFLLTIVPNPSNGIMNLNLVSNDRGEASIDVFEITGQKVFAQSTNLVEGKNSIQINLSDLSEGTYLIKILSNKELRTGKVILKK